MSCCVLGSLHLGREPPDHDETDMFRASFDKTAPVYYISQRICIIKFYNIPQVVLKENHNMMSFAINDDTKKIKNSHTCLDASPLSIVQIPIVAASIHETS